MTSYRVCDFEQKYVHDVYDSLAQSSSSQKSWQNVEDFIASFPPASIITDLGCGKGTYLDCSKNNFVHGLERSSSYARMVREKGHQVVCGDLSELPYRSTCFDGVLCVAVIHHLATRPRRKEAISEICRVLRVGGRAFISAWAMETAHKEFEGHDVLVPITPKHPSPRDSPVRSFRNEPTSITRDDTSFPTNLRDDPPSLVNLNIELDDIPLVSKMNTLCVSAENEITQLKQKLVLNVKDYLDDKRTLIHTFNGPKTFKPPKNMSPKHISPKVISDKLARFSPKRRLSPSSDELRMRRGSSERNYAEKLANCVNGITKKHVDVVNGNSLSRKDGLEDQFSAERVENGDTAIQNGGNAYDNFAEEHRLQKYYHVFTQEELRNLIGSTKQLSIIEQYFDNRNWVFIVKKIS